MLWRTKCAVIGMGLLLLGLRAGAAELPGSNDRVEFRIDAPTMMGALIQFTQQTGLQLVFPTDGATQLVAPKVTGTLTPRAALEQLLRDSGLTFEFVNSRTVSVSPKTTASSASHIAPADARPSAAIP